MESQENGPLGPRLPNDAKMQGWISAKTKIKIELAAEWDVITTATFSGRKELAA